VLERALRAMKGSGALGGSGIDSKLAKLGDTRCRPSREARRFRLSVIPCLGHRVAQAARVSLTRVITRALP
jgi:hypothetical protein